jgi:hypothetical protein
MTAMARSGVALGLVAVLAAGAHAVSGPWALSAWTARGSWERLGVYETARQCEGHRDSIARHIKTAEPVCESVAGEGTMADVCAAFCRAVAPTGVCACAVIDQRGMTR